MAKKRKAKSSSQKPETAKEASSSPAVPPHAGAVVSDQSAETYRGRGEQCVVVGIGASAGGLESFKRLMRALPCDLGIAYVLVQHLDPTHESLMAHLLSKYTDMPVEEVTGNVTIRPNQVYLIPPNKFLRLRGDTLHLDEPVRERGTRMPIDHFFRSLAEARGRRAISIVLSGTGSDGTLGLKAVKGQGGIVIVQQPDTADFDGMPRSAVSSGTVDVVASLEQMPKVIDEYVRHSYVRGSGEDMDPDAIARGPLQSIISLLQTHTDYDFRCYKRGTIGRRIRRRMSLLHIESVEDYVETLRSDVGEVQRLFRDLLIGVTQFFRDPEAWQDLEEQLARIVGEKQPGEPFRAWVAGCATGEEAYSLAILIHEQMKRQGKQLDVQIFATDIDSDAVAIARMGFYPISIVGDVLPDRLTDFFSEEEGRYRVKKPLRESCIFAIQNVIGDPPFSNLDLVTCRNVLIYLELEIQKRLIGLFHFALAKGGLLLLGTSESATKQSHLFDPISKSNRIYRKIETHRTQRGNFPILSVSGRRSDPDDPGGDLPRQRTPAEAAERVLLEKFAPTAVLIDRRFAVQFYHGSVRDYLDFPKGEPTSDLVQMVFDGLKTKVRAAVLKAFQENQRIELIAPRVRRDGKHVAVRITAVPVSGLAESEPHLLVTFADEPVRRNARGGKTKHGADAAKLELEQPTVEQLEYELQAMREDLQSTIEELETSNEELKASNEEIMSMNEEIQSTNEELETSREELQSLNEELNTVNNQLEDKVEELESTNNDLANLLASADTATIFLDTELRIRRFTPATTEILRVIDRDVGRPIADLSLQLHDANLIEDARLVLKKLQPVEQQLQGEDGRWFLRRIMPFRTSENRIDGVVVTFSDISAVMETTRRLEAREQQQAAVATLGAEALKCEDLQLLFDQAVRSIKKTIDVELTKVLQLLDDKRQLRLVSGIGWRDGAVGHALVSAGFESQAGYTLEQANPVVVEDLKTETRFHHTPILDEHHVVSGISVLIGSPQQPWGVLGVHTTSKRNFGPDDIHFVQSVANILSTAIENERYDRRLLASERQLQQQYAELEAIYEEAPVGLAVHDPDLRIVRINQRMAQINGVGIEQSIGRTLSEVCPDVARNIERHLNQVKRTGRPVTDMEIKGEMLSEDGVERFFLASYHPVLDDRQDLTGIVAVVQDITDRKRIEQSRKAAYDVAHQLSQHSDVDVAMPAILKAFSEPLDLDLCEFWQMDDDGFLRCRHFIAPQYPQRTEALRLIFDDIALRSGQSLVGRAYATRQSQVASDLESNENFAREVASIKLNLRSGYAFPVLIGEEVVGVMSFFSRRRFSIPDKLHHLGETVGRDIGEFVRRVRAEEASNRSREEADRANQSKSEFLANMSHEIRTPMAAIMGFAELLEDRIGEDPECQDHLSVIRRNGQHLLTIINDILDLSKIEAGKYEVHRKPLDCLSVASEVISLMQLRAAENGLELGFRVRSKIPQSITSDVVRIRQILLNLIGNAIKFTNIGRVDLDLWFEPSQHRLVFEVADTGIGITAEAIEQLFEPFHQSDNSDARSHGGTGLGLAISRRMARMLGGDVRVESEVGVGSRFQLTIPVAESEAQALIEVGCEEPESPAPRAAERKPADRRARKPLIARILIVDDRKDMRFLARRILEAASATVEVAEDGRQALDVFDRSRQAGTPFDLVLMDMQMPEMDGYEATRRLRSDGFDGPIIALTADAMQGDQKQCIEVGCNGYLTKPIDREGLLDCVVRMLQP